MDHPLLRGVEVWDVAGIGDDNSHLEENAADQTTADASHSMIVLFFLILQPATMVRSSQCDLHDRASHKSLSRQIGECRSDSRSSHTVATNTHSWRSYHESYLVADQERRDIATEGFMPLSVGDQVVTSQGRATPLELDSKFSGAVAVAYVQPFFSFEQGF